MQTERRVAANPQIKPTDLGCESADRLLPSADTIVICVYAFSQCEVNNCASKKKSANVNCEVVLTTERSTV